MTDFTVGSLVRARGREWVVLERLRAGVEGAIVALGTGFLRSEANRSLHEALERNDLDAQEVYRQLLVIVYRVIFILVAEDRGALLDPGAPESARERYRCWYSARRLCDIAGERRGDRHGDLWRALCLVMQKLWDGSPELALPALGSFLFRPSSIAALADLELANEDLLAALRALAHVELGSARQALSFRDVGAEELGSVHESLLELHPNIHPGTARFELATAPGHERRATGAYYTPSALVDALLDAALDPVLDEAAQKAEPERAILDLKVCDPACGSGLFLVAAARRIAARLAGVRSGGAEPSAGEIARALRDVVAHCIFGVDLKPLAVELAKIALWLEAIEPGRPLSFLDGHLQQGNALLGATPALMADGIPDEAFEPIEGDDKKVAAALKKQNRKERAGPAIIDPLFARAAAPVHRPEGQAHHRQSTFLADAWCAAFVWPKREETLAEGAITEGRWQQMVKDPATTPASMVEQVRRLQRQHSFFHWHLAFPQIFQGGGFDVVLGNPPWIAHAGRAAQPLPLGVKQLYRQTSSAFAGYPTTHGVFVHLGARLLRRGGRLGLVIPTSVSELGKYAPARAAHDALCGFTTELVDFGEGQFVGVTQPCMALVSQRMEGGRTDAPFGAPWPMLRPDLDERARALLGRIAALPTLPPHLFGERGFQSDRDLAAHFMECDQPRGRFTLPLREGTDVREFQLLPPRHFADPEALGRKLRDPEEYQAVSLVLRQTARYPIAARSDGVAFRNSLLAGFADERWPVGALLAILNSSFVRWAHYFRFRDARQPIMPQVKIGHLRLIPAPPRSPEELIGELHELGQSLSLRNTGVGQGDRREIDRRVAELYQLAPEERDLVERWHDSVSSAQTQLPEP